jgi:folate-binding protein YgfZ
MSTLSYAPLPYRALLAVSGEDRHAFLQGLVSNDILRASPDRAIWSAFLTPQGRFLHEFFVSEDGGASGRETLMLEAEADRRADLVKRLSLYRLRSKAAVAPLDGWAVYALWGEGAAKAIGLDDQPGTAKSFGGGHAFVDPRLAEAGLRAWLPQGSEETLNAAGFALAPLADWDARRISLGLPDGSRDLVPDKSILLENGFDELNGIDWRKGCYMGQELTARTKYRGLVRKRLMPVAIDGPAPAPGTPIMLGDVEAGEMRSAAGGVGLALIRLEQFAAASSAGTTMIAGEARLRPVRPVWANWENEEAAAG